MRETEGNLPDLINGSRAADSEQSLDAAIYARTSSSSQQFGYSIEGQVRQCWERCQQMGWSVTHVFQDEEISGKDTDRPMFQKLLSRSEAGAFDVIVFWKLDRFSRSLMHAVKLEKELRDWGIALHSITEQIDTTTPAGRFNFRNISSASEFERELIKQRSQMGMKELAVSQKWPNDHPPLGYEKCPDDTLEIDPSEAETVRMIFRRYIELESMPELAAELNRAKITTKEDGEWSARGIGDILRNELYIGNYSVADVEEHVPEYQLLDEELFEHATDVRTRFQQDEEASRDQMPESRKEQQVMEVIEQFRDYLAEQSSTDPLL